jgi:ferric-dicitrate binding protein FerR (iron transport regulator)
MKNTRAEELMAAYLSGNLKAGERDELMQWVDESSEGRSFFDKAISLWNITEQMAYPDFSAGKAQSWDKINQRLDAPASTTKAVAKVYRLRILRWSAAAAIALLAVAGWWWLGQQASGNLVATTSSGERQEIVLPDGTSVWLNENSHLTYEDRDDERYLQFEGEAFFDVATDSIRPFRIYSGQSVTTVLGTAFNLRAYPQEEKVEVSVKEGRVALAQQVTVTKTDAIPDNQNRIELSKGETGVLEKATSAVAVVSLSQDNSTAWKDRRLQFDDVPLKEVAQTLERYYNIEIDLANEGIAPCLVTLGEENDPSLDMIISLLEVSLDLTVAQEGDNYRFSGQACH